MPCGCGGFWVGCGCGVSAGDGWPAYEARVAGGFGLWVLLCREVLNGGAVAGGVRFEDFGCAVWVCGEEVGEGFWG